MCGKLCSLASQNFVHKYVLKQQNYPTSIWQNGSWEISWSTIPYLTSKEELYKMKLSFKRRDDLQNGVYKTGWLNPTHPD